MGTLSSTLRTCFTGSQECSGNHQINHISTLDIEGLPITGSSPQKAVYWWGSRDCYWCYMRKFLVLGLLDVSWSGGAVLLHLSTADSRHGSTLLDLAFFMALDQPK